MRISDWSSDVCSSDLLRAEHEAHLGSLEVDRAALAPRLVEHLVELVQALDLRQLVADEGARLLPIFPGHAIAHRVPDLGVGQALVRPHHRFVRSEEHTSELQSLMRISYAVFCLKKKKQTNYIERTIQRETSNTHH